MSTIILQVFYHEVVFTNILLGSREIRMRLNQWMNCLATGLMLVTAPLTASTVLDREQLQMSQCLAGQLTSEYRVLAENKAFKIVDVSSKDVEKITLLADKLSCGRFVNVSHRLSLNTLQASKISAEKLLSEPLKKTRSVADTSYSIQHQSAVSEVINNVKVDNILATLTHLTSYYNRSASKKTGVDTANWLKASFETLAHKNNRDDTATWFVKTGSRYIQPSLVTVIGKDIKAPAIIIGAHMDTLDGRMPGAGDDGSGSADVMEIARVLLESSTPLKRPVYLIWYSAEERGLVGSQYVVADFLKKAIPVKAAIQLDMTGFRNNPSDPTMWVYRDFTDSKLTDFVAKLIETYIGVPVAESSCGYGCSDHASWMEVGVPAAFPCETDFENHNDKIHTSKDTADRLTPEHMVNFAKLGLAFVIELASD
jgi:bacterial leucyl aminopeptidase